MKRVEDVGAVGAQKGGPAQCDTYGLSVYRFLSDTRCRVHECEELKRGHVEVCTARHGSKKKCLSWTNRFQEEAKGRTDGGSRRRTLTCRASTDAITNGLRFDVMSVQGDAVVYVAAFHSGYEEWIDGGNAATHAEERLQIERRRLHAGMAILSVGCGCCVERTKHDALTEGQWCHTHITMGNVGWWTGSAERFVCGCTGLRLDHHGLRMSCWWMWRGYTVSIMAPWVGAAGVPCSLHSRLPSRVRQSS